MLVTMQNADLIRKLMELAGGDVDLVQDAIRSAATADGADLQRVVEFIAAHRRAAAAAAAAA